jgi:hypothetical protein
MNDSNIFERTIPSSWQILGLKLQPFALGHLVLLERFGSAFVGGKPNPNPFTDLALAVFICSRSYDQALADVADPDLPSEMERWEQEVAKQSDGKPIPISEKLSLFTDYLNAHDLRFEKDKDYTAAENSRGINIPFVHAVRVKLQSRMHFSDSEIFNRPWALCLLDYYILADMDGMIALTDRDALKTAVADAMAIADKLALLLKEGKVHVG